MSEARRPTRLRKASTSSSSPAALGVVTVGVDFADEYPDGDPEKAAVYATLIRTGAALIQEIERCMLATFDMTQTVLNSLAIIDGAAMPLTPSDIGERMLVSSATMTSTLDQLEYRGLVRRMPNPDDRRSMLVQITDEGKAVANRLLPGIRKIEQAVLGGLTVGERAALLKLLGKVLHGAATVAADSAIMLEGRRVRPKHLR